MKYFSECLVALGGVEVGSMVRAQIAQLEGAPTLADIIFRHHLLPEEAQLDVFSIKDHWKCDYHTAWKRSEHYSGEILEKARGIFHVECPSLTKILLDTNAITAEELLKCFDEYLSELAHEEQGRLSDTVVSSQTQANLEQTAKRLIPLIQTLLIAHDDKDVSGWKKGMQQCSLVSLEIFSHGRANEDHLLSAVCGRFLQVMVAFQEKQAISTSQRDNLAGMARLTLEILQRMVTESNWEKLLIETEFRNKVSKHFRIFQEATEKTA